MDQCENRVTPIVNNSGVTLPEGLDAEFIDILNEVIIEHEEAFKGLVDR